MKGKKTAAESGSWAFARLTKDQHTDIGTEIEASVVQLVQAGSDRCDVPGVFGPYQHAQGARETEPQRLRFPPRRGIVEKQQRIALSDREGQSFSLSRVQGSRYLLQIGCGNWQNGDPSQSRQYGYVNSLKLALPQFIRHRLGHDHSPIDVRQKVEAANLV
jgi:hypothetical protein